jgi:hypothetical protein
MPYALIPEGFTLKKVTKTQEKAVKDLRRSDYIKELLDNESTFPIIVSGVVALIGGGLLTNFIKELDIPTVSKEQVETAKTKAFELTLATNPLTVGPSLVDKVFFEGEGTERATKFFEGLLSES